ncbi:PiggyBac transposable element-derived protein 4 [Plakobranchus ocellatus]|uniref:PiggyBac transposable element-derived protein 4 n=1 Tax=Plakobranchus ocellatus TaxID=259542 RepID=A0AAV3Y6A9_9GAST|nr:PiggyBac transposable element-derived protein 4 [Plakobranchus ocellatus]
MDSSNSSSDSRSNCRPNSRTRKRTAGGFTAEQVQSMCLDSDFEIDLDNDSDFVLSGGEESESESSDEENSVDPNIDLDVRNAGGCSGQSADQSDEDHQAGNQARSRNILASDREWVDIDLGLENGDQEQDSLETENSFRFVPKSEVGVNRTIVNENSNELDCFSAIITDEVLETLTRTTNDFAKVQVQKNTPARKRSRFLTWVNTTCSEMLKLFAVVIMMGVDPRPSIRDYWASHPGLLTPWYATMFARERFEAIYQTMVHAGESQATGKAKIEPFIRSIMKRCQECFTPGQNLSIDEMIIGFKGRWKYRQFNASKPHKYHVKSFGLVDSSTGYVCELLIYFGSETSFSPELDPTSSHAVKIFKTLLEPVGKGHHIFADRFYTTKALVMFLLQEKQYYTGTLQTNRKGFPNDLKTLKLAHKQSRYWKQNDGKIICCAFKDKKAKKHVTMVSTKTIVANVEVRPGVSKPQVVHTYNQFMNGCDRSDQSLGYYGIHNRRSNKWWKKIFLWILEIAMLNAFILFKQRRPAGTLKSHLHTFKNFKLNLVTQLARRAITSADPSTPVPTPSKRGRKSTTGPVERFTENKHLIVRTNEDRRCKYCSTPDKPVRTSFNCEGCSDTPHLHPAGCFKAYHTA